MNPYEELGVPPNATQEEIDAAFRAKAREHHPDHGGDGAKFRQIALAKEILSDEQKRKQFDQNGETERLNEVQAAVAELIDQILVSDRMPLDPIREMCVIVDRTREANKREVESQQRKADRLAKRLERFVKQNEKTKNTPGRDFIAKRMEMRIECIRNDIKRGERLVEVANHVLAFLNDLKYSEDPMGAMGSFGTFRSGGPSFKFTMSNWG